MNNTPDKICFFFGSGISLAAGMPGVNEITRSLFEGKYSTNTEGWVPNIDKLFQPSSIDCNTTVMIKQFLREIGGLLGDTAMTYESLFAIVSRLSKRKTDPFQEAFLRELHNRYPCPDGVQADYEEWASRIYEISTMADFYIQSVVYCLLSKLPERDQSGNICGIGVLSDLAKKVSHMDIFTLNHDTLVEQQIRDLSDGFDQAEGVKDGFGTFTESYKKNVCLYKLHGSIKWFDVHENIDSIGGGLAYGLSHEFTLRTLEGMGNGIVQSPRMPNFITGIEKEGTYCRGIYGDIFYLQKKVFERYQQIVFCGYGFCDAGINKRIESWLSADESRKRKIILLDKGTLDNNEVIKRLCSINYFRRVEKQFCWLGECSAGDILAMVAD